MIHFLPPDYCADGNRPGGHLNLGTIEEMLDHLIAQGTHYSSVEEQIELDYNIFGSTAKSVAKKIKSTNFLSKYNFAVCHKIPYSSFEKALIALMNREKAGTATAGMWQAFTDLNQALGGASVAIGYSAYYNAISDDLKNAINAGNQNLACSLANGILNDFDKSSENLYFGFGSTNSSISDNADLHFNLNDPAADVPPTPRGLNFKNALNAFETAMGMARTNVIEVTAASVRWVMTSTAHGKKSQGMGYVASTKGW